MYFKTLSKYECCACTACEHACPVQAILFVKDNEGFMYPSIDKDKCINCGLCERVCPIEHPNYGNTDSPSVYAAMVKDIQQRKMSSSGGMFYAIANWIIQHRGKVYGATMDAKHQVMHIGVDNLVDLNKLRGSKYVQSDLQHVFLDIKQQLQKGRWCYFVGTGCQVAGLKSFLRKSYDTLLTSDLVCHGVPSQWLFNQHIQYLEKKYDGKLSDYHFRNNESWGGCEIFNITKKNGEVKRMKFPSYNLSPYLYSFMYGMTSRYSCYNCPFACIPRQGDITLADYWGVKEFFPDIDSSRGVSLVLVNTEMGEKTLSCIAGNCEIRTTTLKNGSKFNGNILTKPIKHEHRERVYKEVVEKGYEQVAKTFFRNPQYYSILLKCLLAENKVIKQFIEWRRKIK